MKPKQIGSDFDRVENALKRLIILNENLLIVNLAQRKIPHQIVRKIAGVEMGRITKLLKGIKFD